MHLIGLSTIDYVFITVFFGLYLVIAYLKKSTNDSYQQYVSNITRYNIFSNFSFGLFEIIGFTYFGALYGISAGYFFAVVIGLIMITKLILNKLFNHYAVSNLVELLEYFNLKSLSLLITVFNMIVLICIISLLMDLIYTSLYSLLGLHFSYSVYALFGVCLIAIVIGGRSGLILNKLFLYLVIILALSVLFISYMVHPMHDFSFINKLNFLAAKQKLDNKYYTSLLPLNKFHLSIWLYSILMFFIQVVNYKKMVGGIVQSSYFRFGLSLLVLCMLLFPSIIALTTTPQNIDAANGRRFITQETQFSDGQMGYIIKAVDTNSDTYIAPPGIVPQFLDNPDTLLAYDGAYNYSIANLMAFEYYVPMSLMFVCLLMVLSGFLINIGDYLFQLSQLMVDNILSSLKWIDKYGEIGKLWSLRISLFSFGLITLVIAKFTVVWFGPLYG